ncbi:hypothetical protein HPB51_018074 [Rhipicephalus microplus]|uniref:Uncharacterized protein n=1 Tax=Rhipicephalus microplus TaxID=6941 RepID=A0A9J6E2H3_RHIMP|nr:hypothetical protein HPB51_018074 [Rhipicephalus microplus]
MSSKWRTCRSVRREYDKALSELGITQFVVGPRCDFLQNDGVRAARVAPFNPPEPESRRRQANETSMDNADEPAPKRFNAVSESEDDCTCEQDADLVECGEESEGVPLCMQSGPECSSSDEDSSLGCESSDDGVTSDSRTGPGEGAALTSSAMLSVESAELPASTHCRQA